MLKYLLLITFIFRIINAGYLLDGGSSAECWLTDLSASVKVQTYLSGGCPSTISLAWVDQGPSQVTAGTTYPLTYKFSTTLSIVRDSLKNQLRHANLHSCLTYLGACVPSVAVSPGLVTQTKVQASNFSADGTGTNYASVTTDLSLTEGKWTVLAHVRIVSGFSQYDVAIASIKTVVPISEEFIITQSAKIGLIAISACVFLITAIALGLLIFYRKRKVIRFSSVPFSIVMMVGCSICALSPIPFAFVTAGSCIARPVMLMISFTLIFVPLIAKTYRVFRIFGTKKISKMVIPDSQLFAVVALFLTFDFIILACWLGVPSSRPVPTLVDRSGSGVYAYEYFCTAPATNTVATIVVVYKACILCVGLGFAYFARNAPSLFNETKSITGTMSVFVLIVGVGIPLMALIADQPNVTFIIQTAVILLACITVLAQFFVPKFFLLFTVPDEDLQGLGENNTIRVESVVERASTVDVEHGGDVKPSSGGAHGHGLTSREIKVFLQQGTIPSTLKELLKELATKSDALVKKCDTGFRVQSTEVLEAREAMIKYIALTESILGLPVDIRDDKVDKKGDAKKDDHTSPTTNIVDAKWKPAQ